MIPEWLRDIYPNPAQDLNGVPAVIFRDHRWTLPVIYLAGRAGLLELPSRLVTFDRHRDSLAPGESREDLARWRRESGGLERLVRLVRDRLSPRDDDWILSGMELGLISDVVRFGTEPDGMEAVARYRDLSGGEHRVFHLERPARELSWKGALADTAHIAVREGLGDILGWDGRERKIEGKRGGLILDMDLDFFTIGWDLQVFPFPTEVYNAELFSPRQAAGYDSLRPVEFLRALLGAAGVLSVACEPAFCGGASHARTILGDVNRFILGSALKLDGVRVDYAVSYPDV